MYKLETHLHTLGYSPCAQTDTETIAKLYADNRYDGIICTNHFDRYLCENYYKKGSPENNVSFFIDGYLNLKKGCAVCGIDVFFGIELLIDSLTYHKAEPPHAELLIFGITEEWLIKNPYTLFELSLPDVKLLCDRQNWILSQSHPFRDGITAQNPLFLEGAEGWNGNPRSKNHNELALNFAKKNNLLVTCGSDFHSIGDEGCGILLQKPINSNQELVSELRKRRHTLFNGTGPINLQ